MAPPRPSSGDPSYFVGVYDSNGAQLRGEGGSQERELADRYRAMAERLSLEFPNVAKVLKDLAESCDSETGWSDTEAEKDRRLRH